MNTWFVKHRSASTRGSGLHAAAAQRSIPQSPIRNRQSAIANRQSAFTLVELMVVIGIMLLLMGIGTWSYRAMFSGRRMDTAVNTISAAAGATRAFTGRDKASVLPSYVDSGVALIFTPSGEIRMVENIWYAKNSGGTWLEDASDNGYADLPDVQYMRIPAGVGVVAIMRNSTGSANFYAAPFAIRFDEDGHLISGQGGTRVVYYDGNYDKKYDITSTRSSSYDPRPYDPDEDSAYNTDGSLKNWDADARKMELPFEEIETVIGVMVYDKVALKAAGLDLVASSEVVNSGAATWIRENGTPIFFNRYTGAVVKER